MVAPVVRGLEAGQKAALVISECQRVVIDPAFALLPNLVQVVEARGMVEKIADLAATCRKAGIPVIHCTAVLPADPQDFRATCKLASVMRRDPNFREGSPAIAIDERLGPHDTDIIAQRAQGISPFYGDTLEAVLRGLGVETLILAGVSTNIALAGLTIDAVNRGWTVVLPEDCTAGAPPEMHAMMLQHFYALTATVTDLASVQACLAD